MEITLLLFEFTDFCLLSNSLKPKANTNYGHCSSFANLFDDFFKGKFLKKQ